jgi:Raf kinase inhibitor-like YbhB/YbcL family protein
MFLNRSVRAVLGAAALALAFAGNATAEDFLNVKSTTFKDGQMMPRKVANKNPQNSNCVGENISPQLSWSGAPAGTKSYAILMDDPEARGGTGVHHFVSYGIPASITSFAEGELSKPSEKFVSGKGAGTTGAYAGPCTPPGPPHHYTFVVVATDLDPKELPPGLTREEFVAKLTEGGKTHGLAAVAIVGLFQHPKD